MACNCGKNKTPPTGSAAARQAAAATKEQAARTANTSTTRIGPTEPLQGQTQSFALRTRDGSTQQFGSLLEAKAERARKGGEIIP